MVFSTEPVKALSRDDAELRVLHLMGAPGLLRRGPNLIEGALLGVLGAAAASLLLYMLFQAAAPSIHAALGATLGPVDLRFLSGRDLLQLLVFGVSLGAAGGLLTNYSQART